MEEKTKYTPALEEVSYIGQYPNLLEFEKPWEKCIQVGQGNGEISLEGKPLQSEGFSKCSGLILRNKSNLESALFHIAEFDLDYKQTPVVAQIMENYINNLSLDVSEKEILLSSARVICKYSYPKTMKRETFQSRMEELNSSGIMQARFLYGDVSREIGRRIVDSLLSYLGFKLIEDIKVNTGQYHWAAVYYPKESKILIDRRKDKKILSYSF